MSVEEDETASNETPEGRPRRKRGTGFPVVSLSEAARVLKEAGQYGFDHPTPAFASYMGHSSTNSGAFRQRLSAFRDWGLITGSGDMLSMTEVARLIAVPTDEAAERRALQEAFKSCDVFWKLYENSAKGVPLPADGLGGRAVHELGVTPASSSKFVDSFTESALAAQLAEVGDQGKIVLWGADAAQARVDPESAQPSVAKLAQEPQAPAQHVEPVRPTAKRPEPAVRQVWPIDGGRIVFELATAEALPASAFGAIGEVVSKLEALAVILSSDPVAVNESVDGQ